MGQQNICEVQPSTPEAVRNIPSALPSGLASLMGNAPRRFVTGVFHTFRPIRNLFIFFPFRSLIYSLAYQCADTARVGISIPRRRVHCYWLTGSVLPRVVDAESWRSYLDDTWTKGLATFKRSVSRDQVCERLS